MSSFKPTIAFQPLPEAQSMPRAQALRIIESLENMGITHPSLKQPDYYYQAWLDEWYFPEFEILVRELLKVHVDTKLNDKFRAMESALNRHFPGENNTAIQNFKHRIHNARLGDWRSWLSQKSFDDEFNEIIKEAEKFSSTEKEPMTESTQNQQAQQTEQKDIPLKEGMYILDVIKNTGLFNNPAVDSNIVVGTNIKNGVVYFDSDFHEKIKDLLKKAVKLHCGVALYQYERYLSSLLSINGKTDEALTNDIHAFNQRVKSAYEGDWKAWDHPIHFSEEFRELKQRITQHSSLAQKDISAWDLENELRDINKRITGFNRQFLENIRIGHLNNSNTEIAVSAEYSDLLDQKKYLEETIGRIKDKTRRLEKNLEVGKARDFDDQFNNPIDLLLGRTIIGEDVQWRYVPVEYRSAIRKCIGRIEYQPGHPKCGRQSHSRGLDIITELRNLTSTRTIEEIVKEVFELAGHDVQKLIDANTAKPEVTTEDTPIENPEEVFLKNLLSMLGFDHIVPGVTPTTTTHRDVATEEPITSWSPTLKGDPKWLPGTHFKGMSVDEFIKKLHDGSFRIS